MHIHWLIVTLCHWYVTPAQDKLISVAVVFRHGDRNPTVLYPNYEKSNLSIYWKKSELGQLTQHGIVRARTLGQVMLNLYNESLPIHDRLNLASAPIQRCEDSLKHFLYGFLDSKKSSSPINVHAGYSLEAACPKRQELTPSSI